MSADVKMRILIVEDDPALIELLKYNIEAEGFETTIVDDGDNAMAAIEDEQPDLIVLDWMLPNTSGIEICRQIRQNQSSKELPVIMLTARNEEADRIRGLKTGADDYVVKPFSPKELLARIDALMRRAYPEKQGQTLKYEDVELNLQDYRVRRSGEAIHLGPTEFRLLRTLMENQAACIPENNSLIAFGVEMSTSRFAPSMSISDACGKPSTAVSEPT